MRIKINNRVKEISEFRIFTSDDFENTNNFGVFFYVLPIPNDQLGHNYREIDHEPYIYIGEVNTDLFEYGYEAKQYAENVLKYVLEKGYIDWDDLPPRIVVK